MTNIGDDENFIYANEDLNKDRKKTVSKVIVFDADNRHLRISLVKFKCKEKSHQVKTLNLFIEQENSALKISTEKVVTLEYLIWRIKCVSVDNFISRNLSLGLGASARFSIISESLLETMFYLILLSYK